MNSVPACGILRHYCYSLMSVAVGNIADIVVPRESGKMANVWTLRYPQFNDWAIDGLHLPSIVCDASPCHSSSIHYAE